LPPARRQGGHSQAARDDLSPGDDSPHLSGHERAVSLHGVVKRFGPLVAVDGLDLEIPSRVCFGLLGPNGAGKSTTMRMLTGQAVPDGGKIRVLGYELPLQSKLARARLGVVPQESNLDIELSVSQTLEVFAALCRVPSDRRRVAVANALALAGLTTRADDRVATLSGGMQRRLLIARGLVHGPELVLLDEPTVGLDPQVRQELWTLIHRLRDAGKTVLMSTHYIEEAERLADRVAIMAAGRVVAEGPPAELIRKHAGREVHEVEHRGLGDLGRLRADAQQRGLVVRASGPALAYLHAERAEYELPAGHRRAASLEDVFVLLTGEEIE
jgi:lipooligosaccharide transport system ATP-binding protein